MTGDSKTISSDMNSKVGNVASIEEKDLMPRQAPDSDNSASRSVSTPSPGESILILFRLRTLRFFNSILARSMRWRPRVKGPSTLLSAVMALGLVFALFFAHYRVQARLDARYIRQQTESDLEISALDGNLKTDSAAEPKVDSSANSSANSKADSNADIVIALPPAHGFQVPLQYLEAMSLFLTLMAIAGLCLTLGLSDLAKPEWDLEWLSTLPVSRRTLLTSRVMERVFLNPAIQLALIPPLTFLIWKSGVHFLLSLPAAWIASLPVMLVLAIIQTICDTGLRMHRGPAFLKNLQSFLNLAGILPIYLLLFNGFGLPTSFLWLRESCGELLLKTPLGFLAESILSVNEHGTPIYAYLLQCSILSGILFSYLLWQSRDGFEMNGGRNSSKPKTERISISVKFNWTDQLSPLLLREWRMLTRDTTYLTQTLLVPILIITIQIYNRLGAGGASHLNSAKLCSISFGIASYALMFTSVQSLTSEGPALWIIYCLPNGLEKLLRAKTRHWTILATAMALSLLIFGEFTQPSWDMLTIGRICQALVGVPVFATLAASFGVFSFSGASTESPRRGLTKLRPAYVYLYLLLAGMYGWCFYIKTVYPIVIVTALLIFAAYGVWQSALRQLPFLLDNTAAPRTQIRLVQSVLGILLFFAVEVVTLLWLEPWLQSDPRSAVAEVVVTGSTLAGCVVASVSLGVFFYRKKLLRSWLRDLRLRRENRWVFVFDGLWGGAGALMFAGLYFFAQPMMGEWGKEAARHAEISLFQQSLPVWLAFTWITLVPLAFELLFSGLLLRTLRDHELERQKNGQKNSQKNGQKASQKDVERSAPSQSRWELVSSGWPDSFLIASNATLFALVQPELSFLPLFVMGAIGGFLFLKTRSLLPGLVAHVVFNVGLIWVLPNLIHSL